MVRINWLTSAKEDLKEIHDYISLDSKRYAQLQVERIKERTTILKSQIRSGKIVEELNIENVRELVEGNYRIVYRIINNDELDIILIHHSARELSKRL